MSFDIDKLYKLLPAVYRIRDAAVAEQSPDAGERGPLHALLTVISEQIEVLEENFDQLYDDQFIETCAEWVVPYIGDLVGARGIISFPGAPFSQRGQVAKTIAYRRRKGTAAVIEELAFDVTGWNANVVEYFQLLSTHQFLNHLRPENLSIATVRNRELLEFINTPFDKIAHTVDVRKIESRRGKYNIPNVGIFLWRIQNYFLDGSPAFKIDERRYTFDALGRNIALYNEPETEDEIIHLAEPINIPMPIRRFPFNKFPGTYYGQDKSILIIKDGNKIIPSSDSEKLSDSICICDLSDVEGSIGPIPDWSNMPLNKIGIDPVLGRIVLPLTSPPESAVELKVNYNYGFSADIGGGSYERLESFSADLKPIIKVPADALTIQDALNILGNAGGVVEIGNNEYHSLMATIDVPASVKIEIRAAEDFRPVLIINNELNITGGEDSEISFNGLLFCGGLINIPYQKSFGELNTLHKASFLHCTLTPGISPFDSASSTPADPRLKAEADNLSVEISKCITGPLRVGRGATTTIEDSIVDAGDQKNIAYAGLNDPEAGGTLTITNSTVIGRVNTKIMKLASNTIFDAESGLLANQLPVMAERLQEGCVRFSFIPLQSRLPKPFNCQPKSQKDSLRIKPVFKSLRFGDAAYCQLSLHCAEEIRQGAENEMEMGVFYSLYQPLREYNLKARLNEYLRFGLEAGIYYGS